MTKDLNVMQKLWSVMSGRKPNATARISAAITIKIFDDELIIRTSCGDEVLRKGEAMLLAREIVAQYGLGPGGRRLITELNE